MAKLIPGKLRMEGVELYETGQIEIIKEQDHRIYARVAEEEIRYSLDDDLIFCTCENSLLGVLCSFSSSRILLKE